MFITSHSIKYQRPINFTTDNMITYNQRTVRSESMHTALMADTI